MKHRDLVWKSTFLLFRITHREGDLGRGYVFGSILYRPSLWDFGLTSIYLIHGLKPMAGVWLSSNIKEWVYSVNHRIDGVGDQALFCYEVGERFSHFFEYIASPEVVEDVIG